MYLNTVTTSDGFDITTTVFQPKQQPKGSYVIAGATGVPQKFYSRFADFAEKSGYRVTTFDYRGVGQSSVKSLRGFNANYFDWATKDLEAVLKTELKQYKPIVIGHSFGGHAFGMADSSNNTHGLIALGTGSGWSGYMTMGERLKVEFMWRFLAPLLTSVYGYLPSKLVGLGENLPLGVYQQWRHWCSFENYFFDDPEFHLAEKFHQISTPILSVNAMSDAWAPPRSAQVFMSNYKASRLRYWFPDSDETNHRRIGHMDYFKPLSSSTIWSYILKEGDQMISQS